MAQADIGGRCAGWGLFALSGTRIRYPSITAADDPIAPRCLGSIEGGIRHLKHLRGADAAMAIADADTDRDVEVDSHRWNGDQLDCGSQALRNDQRICSPCAGDDDSELFPARAECWVNRP